MLNRNLQGAKFTLAVPTYIADKGIKDFADLQKHADDFDQPDLRNRARRAGKRQHPEDDRRPTISA